MDIKKFADRKGMSFNELSKKLGISSASMSHLKNGTFEPRYKTICSLISFGMTFNELFGDKLTNVGLSNAGKLDLSNKLLSLQDVENFLLNLEMTEFYKFIEVVQHKRFRKNQFHALLNMGYSEEDAKKLDLEFEKENLERSTPEFQKSIHEEMDKLFNSK